MAFFGKLFTKKCDPINDFRRELRRIDPSSFTIKGYKFYKSMDVGSFGAWYMSYYTNFGAYRIDNDLPISYIEFIAENYNSIIGIATHERDIEDQINDKKKIKRDKALNKLRKQVCD